MAQSKKIGKCQAVIYKLQTMTDGGIRLTLDLDASNIELIQKLMAHKLYGDPLITISMEANNGEEKT